MKLAVLLFPLAAALELNLPQLRAIQSKYADKAGPPRTEPTIPTAMIKPLASSLVSVAETFPKVLPFTHAAMDFLVEEQRLALAKTGKVPAAPASVMVADTMLDESPRTKISTESPAEMLRTTFAFAAEQLANLISARFQLLVINLRLALRAKRVEAMDAMQQKIATFQNTPALLVREAEQFVTQKRQELTAMSGIASSLPQKSA